MIMMTLRHRDCVASSARRSDELPATAREIRLCTYYFSDSTPYRGPEGHITNGFVQYGYSCAVSRVQVTTGKPGTYARFNNSIIGIFAVESMLGGGAANPPIIMVLLPE